MFDMIRNKKFDVNDIENKTLKNIVSELISIKSLKEFHIETIDSKLYICLFDVSQLNSNNIVKMLNRHGISSNTYITECNYGMSYMPTTEIFTSELDDFKEELMFYC